MLSLNKRPARIGPSINTPTEKHGEEDVPACDIPIEGIMLEREELNALLDDPYAHDALFNHRSQGKVDEPIFRKFKALQFREKFEEGAVTFFVGMGAEKIELKSVKLARVTLDPQVGGLTELSLSVQCNPSADTVAQLFTYMNHDVEVEIAFGKKVAKGAKQVEMPINTFGNDEAPQPAASTDIGPDTREEIEKLPRGRRRKGGESASATH